MRNLELTNNEILILYFWLNEYIDENPSYKNMYMDPLIQKIEELYRKSQTEYASRVKIFKENLDIKYDEKEDETFSYCCICNERMVLKGTFEYGFYWECDHCNTRYL